MASNGIKTGQYFLYEEVPAWAVPKESADGARKMLLFCIADLQLSCKINIRWFNEYSESIPEKGRLFSEETEFTRDEQIQGCVFLQGDSAVSNAIWINYELDPATIPRTVAHEARHIYQAMHRETLVKHGKEADKEPDAIRYAFEAMEAFKHHRSCLEYAINRTNKIIKVI